MQRQTRHNVSWLQFDLLANIPHLKHGVFLRHGGFSSGPYTSLNLSQNVGDHPDHVAANRQKVCALLGIQTCVRAHQIHGDQVVIADPLNPTLPQCDAFITNRPEVGLLITHADCQAALFYDPVHHALANVHCGWRGSVQNIYAKTVAAMQKTYGSKPENLLVGIAPSLGPSHAEFRNYRTELPEHFWDFQVKPTYFDFWSIAEMQLVHCGIQKNHIEFANICTYGTPEDCYSFRRSQIRGGHGTLAMLTS